MAVGEPTRPRYQRLAFPHQTRPVGGYLDAPPAVIPTANPVIFVPRQDISLSLSLPSSDGVSELSGSFSEPPSSSDPPSSSTSEPPSTTDESSTQSSSTSESSSTISSSTSTSTSSRESSSSRSELSSTSSLESSITPTPSETSESSSLTFSPETTITSAVVLTIDGRRTTSYVSIPTTLTNPGNRLSPSERTAVIAGSVAGGVALILLVAAIILFYRRHQNKKKGFFPAFEPKPRTMLLAGEDLDDEYAYSYQTSNAPTPIPSSVRRVGSPVDSLPRSVGVDQSPRLLRPRASDTGSIFHEGGIWPPPSGLVDPILAGSHINLTNIVNEVMGSSAGQQNDASGSGTVIRPRGGSRSTNDDTSTTNSEGSIYSTDLPAFPPNPGQGHHRDSSNSEAPLIPPEPLYLASTHNSGSSPSIPQLPYESGFSGSSTSLSRVTNPNGTKNWLDRSPRKFADSPTNPFTRNPSPLVPDNERSRSSAST